MERLIFRERLKSQLDQFSCCGSCDPHAENSSTVKPEPIKTLCPNCRSRLRIVTDEHNVLKIDQSAAGTVLDHRHIEPGWLNAE